MSEKLPIPTANPLDYHARTANHDKEFQTFMDALHPGWREMHERDIRDFAKRWNWGRLYGAHPRLKEVVVHIDGADVVKEITDHLPELHRVEHVQVGEVSRTVLSGTEGAPGTIDPPPTPETAVRTAQAPPAWPKVPASTRRWDHGGLTANLNSHGLMATLVIPMEVLSVFAETMLREWRAVEENMADNESTADEIAHVYGVRPDAVKQAFAIAQHARHVVKG